MKAATILTIFSGTLFLLGCADTGHYPISGQSISTDDQVKFMSVPNTLQY